MGTNYRIYKFNELNSLTLNERVKDKKQRAFKGASLTDKVKLQTERIKKYKDGFPLWRNF